MVYTGRVFDFTQKEFYAFVEKVRNGDESIFVKIYNTHFTECIRYLQKRFNLSEELAYDVCMDTMVEFRIKLIQGKIEYGNLRYLFTRMASNNYVDTVKRSKRVNNAETLHLESLDKCQEPNCVYTIEHFDALNNFIEKLKPKQRQFFEELFYTNKSSREIINEYGITGAALRKRKQRFMRKLKNELKIEMAFAS